MQDELGDRMKLYEGAESARRLMPLLPVIARMDGRAFRKFTKGMHRPYDPAMSACMLATTIALVEHTGACMGYTQSDEITLAWHSTTMQNEIWFSGRVLKMASCLAAYATVQFFQQVQDNMSSYARRSPTFDARVWNMPNRTEAANAFLWREWDATKNSITLAASQEYTVKQLHKKNGEEMKRMLDDKGVVWDDYPTHFKRGLYVQRKTTSALFTTDELKALPAKHAARANPMLAVERSQVEKVYMPPLGKVTNRVEVIFDGEDPICEY